MPEPLDLRDFLPFGLVLTGLSVAKSLALSDAFATWSGRTMRVKKADIAAFAQGKASPEEFEKRVMIAVYPGTGYGIISVNSWIQSGDTTATVRRR